jgi:hypothetical protein
MTNQLNTISLADLSSVTGGVAVRNVGGVVNDSVVNRGVVGVGSVGVGSAVGRGVVGVGNVPSVVGVGNVSKPVVDPVGVVGPRVVQ